jgi:RNA polymerase sigma factor (sigma-70 family)
VTTETQTIDRDALAVDNLALAKDYIRKYPSRGLDPEEALDACNMGVFRAAREYDPSRGSFSSYAFWKMTGEVSETAKMLAYPMKIRPGAARRVGRRTDSPAVRATRTALTALHHRVPCNTPSLLAYDERHGTDPVATAIGREERLEADVAISRVMEMVDRLPSRERLILTRRFGLDGSDPSTYSDIARELGVSRWRASEIGRQAIERIRINLGVVS